MRADVTITIRESIIQIPIEETCISTITPITAKVSKGKWCVFLLYSQIYKNRFGLELPKIFLLNFIYKC